MKKKITVDGTAYSVVFENNEFSFTLINSSRGKIHVPTNRLWEEWHGDVEELNHDIDMNTNVFALSRELIAAFVDVLKRESPALFFFSANSAAKVRVYSRFARELEKALGGKYRFQAAGSLFYFSKT